MLPLILMLAAGCNKIQPSVQTNTAPKITSNQPRGTDTANSNPPVAQPQNCGQMVDEHFSALLFGDASKLTVADKATAKCMTTALLGCKVAADTDYSSARKETITEKIVGAEGTSCKVYQQNFKGGDAPKICKIPIDVISAAYDKSKKDNSQDYTFHILIPVLFLSADTGTYTHPGTGQKLKLECQAA